ncbi:MAG: PaaI family thioesterase [Thermodesulfobacteriota bacterium]
MEHMKTVVDHDRFAAHVGIRLTAVGAGYARAELDVADCHLNGLGTAHGGVIFTLADLAFAAASNSHGIDAMAVTVHISYFKAVREGTLIAEATELSLNRKLATYAVHVSEKNGDRVAAFVGTAYRKSPKDGAGRS